MRLNESIRNEACAAMLRHAFDDREKALSEKRAALAVEYYEAAIPADVRAAMDKVPSRFFNMSGAIYVETSAIRGRVRLELPELRPMPFNTAVLAPAGEFPELEDRIADCARDTEALQALGRETKKKILATLSSVRTIKQLEKVWPEAVPFVQACAPESKQTALSVPVKELNEALGLPPEANA